VAIQTAQNYGITKKHYRSQQQSESEILAEDSLPYPGRDFPPLSTKLRDTVVMKGKLGLMGLGSQFYGI
jgi:hypothetical protein